MNRAYLCFINPYEHPSIFLTNVNLSHGYHPVIRVTSCLNFVILSEAKDLFRWVKIFPALNKDRPYPTMQTMQNML